MSSIVIASTARTPMGAMLGAFTKTPAPVLGGHAIKACVERAGIKPDLVESVIMGCVLMAGQGQAPARQASRFAGLPDSTTCSTLNKMCGSGLEAVTLAHDLILAGRVGVMIAGGLENMTRAPHLLTDVRAGYRLGNRQVYDHMLLDGLLDPYEDKHMGEYAEATVEKYNFTREDLDNFATTSLLRAQEAINHQVFKNEITPVDEQTTDETAQKLKAEKIPTLKAAFKNEGKVTAANSSGIADGAAAHLLMREEQAKSLNIQPMARIVGHASHAQEPAWFTTAPSHAIQKLLKKLDWKVEDVDLFEINEAFAVVAMAAMKDLNIPHEKLNIYGGACALGHPIGASGARILTTLVYALQKNNLKRGIASLCIGGGEAVAIAVERV